MKIPTFNWFDLLVLVVISVGILRGRKRGMSEEVLDLLQWLCIVVGGAYLYKFLSPVIRKTANLDLFTSNVLSYVFVAVAIKLLFTFLKRGVGEKLVQSDTFGRMEYYLGMMAGATRFFAILLFCLNFLHAYYISDAERAATAKMQAENFGSISFPTIGSLQQGVFYESVSCKLIHKHLETVLVEPASTRKGGGDTIGKRRQRDVEEVLK